MVPSTTMERPAQRLRDRKTFGSRPDEPSHRLMEAIPGVSHPAMRLLVTPRKIARVAKGTVVAFDYDTAVLKNDESRKRGSLPRAPKSSPA